jgi:hypothetical protein
MLHTDMAILDSMIAARQEQVAISIQESRRPMPVRTGLGSLLILIGQWLSQGPRTVDDVSTVLPSRKRPQLT